MGPIGGGLFTATAAAADVPPPGVAFTAVKVRLPVLTTSAAVSATSTCVALTKIVVRALPFTSITVVGTNPVPATEITGDTAPSTTDAGIVCVIAGAGFVTSRLAAALDPLPAEPFHATTESCDPLATCAAVTVTVTSVLLT